VDAWQIAFERDVSLDLQRTHQLWAEGEALRSIEIRKSGPKIARRLIEHTGNVIGRGRVAARSDVCN
jgi:hypothetical protein